MEKWIVTLALCGNFSPTFTNGTRWFLLPLIKALLK
jgi:hypothetical protein